MGEGDWFVPDDWDDPGDHFTGDGGESDQALERYIHGPPRQFRRTSTYDPDSAKAMLGRMSEHIAKRELTAIAPPGVSVMYWKESYGYLTAEAAIHNSQNGDLCIVRPPLITHSIEVKSSLDYPNATINDRELAESSAKYLVALTTAGLWACTMDAARTVAVERGGRFGKFWVIYHDRVTKVPLERVFE